VKEAVLPFDRFRTADDRGVDCALGPEMRSTGEVMGMDTTFDLAFAKAHLASGSELPTSGRLYVATGRKHVRRVAAALRTAQGLGFEVVADAATGALLAGGVTVSVAAGGGGADAVETLIASRAISLAVSISGGGDDDGEPQRALRTAAARHGVPHVTTIAGLFALLRAIRVRAKRDFGVISLQEAHARARQWPVAVPPERVGARPSRWPCVAPPTWASDARSPLEAVRLAG